MGDTSPGCCWLRGTEKQQCLGISTFPTHGFTHPSHNCPSIKNNGIHCLHELFTVLKKSTPLISTNRQQKCVKNMSEGEASLIGYIKLISVSNCAAEHFEQEMLESFQFIGKTLIEISLKRNT